MTISNDGDTDPSGAGDIDGDGGDGNVDAADTEGPSGSPTAPLPPSVFTTPPLRMFPPVKLHAAIIQDFFFFFFYSWLEQTKTKQNKTKNAATATSPPGHPHKQCGIDHRVAAGLPGPVAGLTHDDRCAVDRHAGILEKADNGPRSREIQHAVTNVEHRRLVQFKESARPGNLLPHAIAAEDRCGNGERVRSKDCRVQEGEKKKKKKKKKPRQCATVTEKNQRFCAI
jgi:hypothetical protein